MTTAAAVTFESILPVANGTANVCTACSECGALIVDRFKEAGDESGLRTNQRKHAGWHGRIGF